MFGLSTHRSPQRTSCERQHRYRYAGLRLAVIFFSTFFMLMFASLQASYAATNAVTWPPVQLQPFASGFDDPIDVESAHDGTGRLFVLEKGGIIKILDHGKTLATPFLDIHNKVATCNECGLLGLAFPPDFTSKGYFFIDYINNGDLVPGDTGDPNGSTDEVVARYHLSGNANVANANSEEKILVFNKPAENHNGGHILFGPDGFLYLGTGDGGGGGDGFHNGQDRGSLLGKILRIQASETGTYTIPATNPFTTTVGVRPEIWMYGLRNPWRYNFDRSTGDLYIADVGQNTIEEVDHIAAAKLGNGGFNFGWNIMEGDACYPPDQSQTCNRTGLTLPVVAYQHSEKNSGGQTSCSITGGYVYHSPKSLQAPVYLYGDYCSGIVWGLQADGSKFASRRLLEANTHITSFGEDEDGTIYLVSEGGDISKVAETQSFLHLPVVINHR